MKKKVLFIDRDGTLVIEPPVDYQLDSLEKLEFYPKVFRNLGFIRSKLDFEFVMVTNQDGLGTSSFPEETFWPAHNLMLKTLEGCGDSMIAGFALGFERRLSVQETLRLASAISASAALREETGFFVKEDMERILPQIEIKRL